MDLNSVELKDWGVVENGLNEAISYDEYSQLLIELVDQKRTTGPNQQENLVEFTKLNTHRAKRLNKTASLTDEFKEKLDSITSKQTWLVITESWCGDAVQALPFLNVAQNYSDKISLKVVMRDNDTTLIDMFLTNGGRSIPKLIILDEENKDVIGEWGPRPKEAQEMYMDFKKNPNGRVYADVQIELQKWYLKDKGVTMQNEIAQLF